MSYLKLLKNNSTIFKLSVIQIIAYFGAWFTNVAIYTMLVELNVSAFIISLTAAMHFLPAVLQAPFTGPLIDRLNLKKLMLFLLSVELITTFILIFLNSKDLIWLLLLILYIRMSASSFYFTAEMSLLPQILKGKDLQLANEMHSIIWSFSYAAGMALSGVIVYYFGVQMAILIDVFMFLGAIIILLKTEIKTEIKESKDKFLKMIKDGISYLKKNRLVLHIMLLHSSVGFTAFDALVTLLADLKYKEVLAISLSIGFLNATRAFALMIGPLILAKFLNRENFFYIILAQGISIILWGLMQDNFYSSLFGTFLVGLFSTTIWSYTYTMLHQTIDKEYYGRVIAYNDMLFMLVGVFTSLTIGVLADSGVLLENITYLLGIMFILTSLYYKTILRRLN